MATALNGKFQTHSGFFRSGFYYSLYPKPEPARHPYRNPLGYCRNESPVLQLSYETARAELVQRRNGVHGLGTDRPEE